jgi:S1-C subfamily serine protease
MTTHTFSPISAVKVDRLTVARSFACALVLMAGMSAIAADAPKSATVENAVVKVFSTVRYPDPYRPWTKQAPAEVTGSGVVIEKKRILSNAHVVLYASQVQIQANQAGDKISATVESISPAMDLAVLKLEDESFFDTHPPLPRANTLPDIKDVVMAYGYPEGGTSLSITKGIVSRVEFAPYYYPAAGLRIQIDAAINPGNSGGPAVVNDKMIGLAFSHLSMADNIGYIIPSEEIELFLEDVADGFYTGKPALFDDFQTLETPALRPFLKIEKSVEGMIVNRPDNTDPANPLKKWDIITKIGDTSIDNQGMVKLGTNLRVRFHYLVPKVAKSGKVPLTIVRESKEMKVEVPVATRRSALITGLDGAYPSYFVFGPMVFSTATTDFAGGITRAGTGYGAMLAEIGSPLIRRTGDRPAFDGEKLVIVSSPFLPHKLAQGYSSPIGQVVKSISGKPIKNLTHLVQTLRDSKDEFIVVEFETRHGGETLVFPRADAIAATDDILTDNGVRSQGSPDTMAVWNAKPAK